MPKNSCVVPGYSWYAVATPAAVSRSASYLLSVCKGSISAAMMVVVGSPRRSATSSKYTSVLHVGTHIAILLRVDLYLQGLVARAGHRAQLLALATHQGAVGIEDGRHTQPP